MWKLGLTGISYTIVNLVLNIGLVLGLYLVLMFIKKFVNLGRTQAKYWEVALGLFLAVLAFYLKFYVI